MIGRIVSVQEKYLGSVLSTALAGGETTLAVDDTSDFDAAGTLVIDPEGAAETVAWTAIDDDTGDLTLASAVVGAYSDETEVQLYPRAIERTALLISGDNAEDEEGTTARVPHALYDRIPVGIRDLEAGEGETVSAAFIAGELVIQDITGQAPVVDGSYLAPGTVPTAAITDGDPPSSSPTPTVIGGPSFIAARWTAVSNHDPVTYEVHVSTSTGFTPDGTTLYAETAATSIIVKALPDDSALAYGTTYYVRIIAKDADGAAAAGTEASGSMVKITTVQVNTDNGTPSTPSAPTIVAGPGWIQAKWDAPSGTSDALQYKVYVRAGSDPTVSDDTYAVGTTTALSLVISKLTDGTPLAAGTTYYVKVRAISALSSNQSAASSSGTGSPASIPTSGLTTDGVAPSSSPTAVVKAGPSLLYVSWDPVSNADPVQYEVHLSSSSGFTPGSGTTLLGTTSGSTWVTTVDHGGTVLSNGTTYYVKIVAKDADGSAAAGTQGSAAPYSLPSSAQATDGAAPSAVGSAPTVQGGVGYLAAFWTPVTNNDPVQYEVHVSTTTGFTPGSGTLYLTTPGSSAIIRKDASGAALAYGTTYYVKIVAKDADGSAAASSQGSGSMVQATGGSSGDIAATTITAANIAANTITAAQITAGTITSNEIAAGTITATNIAAATITGAKIAAGTITATNITAGTITTTEIAASTITASNIAAATITGAKIAATTITASNIVSSTITTTQIAANTIVAGNIAAGTITTTEIAASTITASNIAASTITGAKIASGTITATNITAGTITATEIAASTITGAKIAANTITASNIAADTITASEIAASAITASELAAGSVTADKLTASLVLSTKITAGTAGAARIDMGVVGDTNGIYAYGTDGTSVKFSVDADTGNVYAAGRLDFGTGSRLDSDIIELVEQTSSFQVPAIVQNSGGYNYNSSNASSGTTVTPYWGSATAKGSLLLLIVSAIGFGTTSIPTISTPSGWTLVATKTQNVGRVSIFKIVNSASRSGAQNVTVTVTGDPFSNAVTGNARMFEYSGTADLDVSAATNSGTGTSPSTGTTGTTTQANELWFADITAWTNTSYPSLSSPTNSFAQIGTNSNFGTSFGGGTVAGTQMLLSKNVTSTGTASTAVTASLSSTWIGIVATFKAKTSSIDAPDAGRVRIYAVDDDHESSNNNASFLVTQNELGTEKSIEFPGLTRFHSTAPTFFYVHSDFAEISTGVPDHSIVAEGLLLTFNGTGAGATSAQQSNGHVGVARLQTGTTTTGDSQMRTGNANVLPGGGRLRFGAYVRVPTLSDGTNTFYAGVGFKTADALWNNLATTNAIVVRYSSAINGGKWQASCSAGSAVTSVDSGVTVTAGQFYWIELDVDAAGTEAKVYIDGSLKATLNGSNFPTALMGYHIGVMKSASTTSRNFDCDFYYCYWEHGARSSS